MYVEWKDGGGNWMDLKDLKHAHPAELVEYAINNKIEDKPAFAWWIPWTMKIREMKISELKIKYWERTHNMALEYPRAWRRPRQLTTVIETPFGWIQCT